MDKKSEEYLRQYIKLTDTIKQKIEAHAARYHIKAEICAWYSDWEDFCSDWCDICGYSRTEARKLYHGGIGEFMKDVYSEMLETGIDIKMVRKYLGDDAADHMKDFCKEHGLI